MVKSIVRLVASFSFVFLAVASPGYASQIHFYDFTTNADDSVGSANGTLMGGASVSGGVLNLDGTDDFVQFGSHIVPTLGSYTVAMLFAEAAPKADYIELISQGSSGGAGFYIGHNPAGTFRAGDQWISTGVTFPSDTLFHRVALSVDTVAFTSKLYVDGVLAATLASPVSPLTNGSDTRLGRQFEPFDEFFGGQIDNLRIFNTALNAEEVRLLETQAADPVPEPATLLLLGTGLALAAARRRK